MVYLSRVCFLLWIHWEIKLSKVIENQLKGDTVVYRFTAIPCSNIHSHVASLRASVSVT